MTAAIHRRMDARDWGFLVFLSVLWGGSFFFIGVAVHTMPPFAIVAMRVTVAAAALWAIVLITGAPAPRGGAAWLALAGMSVLNNVLPMSLFAWAQGNIPSSLAAIMNATTPLFGVLLAHVFTADEKLTANRAVGVLVGFGGVVVMVGVSALSSLSVYVLAELACLVASASYAASSVYGRRFKAMGLAPLAIAAGQLTCGAAMLVPATLVFDRPWAMPAPAPEALLAVTALALLSTSLAYVIYFRILARAGATNLMLVTFLLPVTAIVLGVLLLGETLEPRHVAGMAMIGLGLAAIDGRPWTALRQALRGGRSPAAGSRPGE
jgi:drug/metabolite transporter (DMT)-like permease